MTRPLARSFLGALLVATIAGAAGAQAKRPITFDDFAAVKAVSDPQLSPDGSRILYAVRTTNVAANRRTTTTFLATIRGGAARAFPDDSTHATEARWSPDGRRVVYSAGDQIWVANADGTGRVQVSHLSGGASGAVWSPAGDRIAFVSPVYPGCHSDDCNAARRAAADSSKVKAHIADRLMFRHWNAWDEGTRSHLFVASRDGSGIRDVTDGATYDVPPGPFGGSEGYAFSPDGRELAYTAKDQRPSEAWSTDINLYVVAAACPSGGAAARSDKGDCAPRAITADNRGADANPIYSPDGRFIAYQSQRRPGFESDRQRLMFYDRAGHVSREVLPRWDRNADGYVFAPNGRSIFVLTTDAGRDKIFRMSLDAAGRAGPPAPLIADQNNSAFVLARDGRTVAWTRDAADRPAEVYVGMLDGARIRTARRLTHVNDALVAQLQLYPVEDFWFTGAEGAKVQGFVVKPPQWEPGKRFPVVLLIHGGPQGAWLDNWHSRWNYQMFAAAGFGLVIVNPRGSTGYGQQFVDDVSKDWAGRVYTDLMNGLDAAMARNSWMDSTRIGAAGGSYGGYMVNWIAGHNPRFKALVSHAGPYNLENMYSATEELWFPEWEYGGPYWDSTAMATQYRKWSPHLFAKNFKAPTLVTGGELDFRVPYTEDLSMFTALQRQGVASRLVMFPDEGHWVLKPQNQRLWWSEVQAWLRRYLGGANLRA